MAMASSLSPSGAERTLREPREDPEREPDPSVALVRTVPGIETGWKMNGGLRLASGPTLAVPAPNSPGTAVPFGIRPEHLTPADDGPITGTVSLVEHLGDETIFHLDGDGSTKLALKGPGDWALSLGQRLSLTPDLARARLFGPDGNRLA